MANFSDSENETSFEVEEILQHRGRGSKVEYLVRWRGFGDEENSWEPSKVLEDSAHDAIQQYRNRVPSLRNSRRSSRGRSDVKTVTVSTKTKSVHVTSTLSTADRKNTQSESSSPENSPAVVHRSLRSRKSAVDDAKGAPKVELKAVDETAVPRGGCLRALLTTPFRMCPSVRLSAQNLPIVVLVSCILVIAGSFSLSVN